MSKKKCSYCNNSFTYKDMYDFACSDCEKLVQKLDKETIDWLVMVIDAKIEKAISDHTDRYEHESSGRYY